MTELPQTKETDLLKPEESELDEPTVAVIVHDTGKVPITYLPTNISREYKAGHNTTFPCEFIDDWKNKVFKNQE